MDKIIVFGTGHYYNEYKYMLEDRYEIVGFIDNDEEKVGTYFDNKAFVYLPNAIDTLIYDKIYLASAKMQDMFYQLVSLGVPNTKIHDIRDALDLNAEIDWYNKAVVKKSVYILCPVATTGGPEALHQLGDCIFRYITPNVFIAYYGNNYSELETPEIYKCYQIGGTIEEKKIPDDSSSIVIIPEIEVDRVCNYRKAYIFLWWLSVDNYFHHRNHHLYHDIEIMDRISLHLCQSNYAYDFLRKCHIPKWRIKMISDYTKYVSHLHNTAENSVYKEDIVVYNPSKGFFYTYGIIKMLNEKGITCIPIEKMSPSEVYLLLKRAKVYIDMGGHPGKDRIPREAAMCGCCIITGIRGAAQNNRDINIPEKYKVDQEKDKVSVLIRIIMDCIVNYDLRSKDFDNYRLEIFKEKKLFAEQVREVFEI